MIMEESYKDKKKGIVWMMMMMVMKLKKYVHTRIYIQKKAYKDKVKRLERKNEKLSRQLRYFLKEVFIF